MFRPLQPDAATAGKDGTPAAPEDGEKAINGGKKGQLGGDPDEGFSDVRQPFNLGSCISLLFD